MLATDFLPDNGFGREGRLGRLPAKSAKFPRAFQSLLLGRGKEMLAGRSTGIMDSGCPATAGKAWVPGKRAQERYLLYIDNAGDVGLAGSSSCELGP